MPTQKPQPKQAKVTQKVGGNPKKPVTKATQGGKVATPMKTKKVKEGGGVTWFYEETKKRSLRNEYLIKMLLKDLYNRIDYYKNSYDTDRILYTNLEDPSTNRISYTNLEDTTNLSDVDLSNIDNVINGNLTAKFIKK